MSEYVLVSQYARRIEHFHLLETAQWLLTVIEGDEARLLLPALGGEIPLGEIDDPISDQKSPRPWPAWPPPAEASTRGA